jgi:hypothetical protein
MYAVAASAPAEVAKSPIESEATKSARIHVHCIGWPIGRRGRAARGCVRNSSSDQLTSAASLSSAIFVGRPDRRFDGKR